MTTRDEFEAWIKESTDLGAYLKKEKGPSGYEYYKDDGTHYAYLTWVSRQKEIDALKAEVERLRSVQVLPPSISRQLLGKIVDEVFNGAIEDCSVIEDIYRSIAAHHQPAQKAEPSDDELLEFAIEEEFLLFCDEDEFLQIARALLSRYGNQSDQCQQQLNMVPADNQDALDIIQRALDSIDRPDGLHDGQWEYIKHGIRMLAKAVNEVVRTTRSGHE